MLLHTDASGKVGERLEAKVEEEIKFRDHMSEFYDAEVMPWVAYTCTDWFKLGLGWRLLYDRKKSADDDDAADETEPPPREWAVESRPLLDLMFNRRIGAWGWDDRVRIENRRKEDADPYFRFRNRLRARAPWKWTRAEWNPWTAWEGYFENDPRLERGDRLNRHRWYVGLSGRLSRSVKAGCYYYAERVLQSDTWASNNEIGLEIGLVY